MCNYEITNRHCINYSKNSLLPTRMVTHIFPDVVASDRQHDRVAAGLQQVDESTEQLLAALVEPRGVLAPELGRLVHGGPFQSEIRKLQCFRAGCTFVL